MAARLRGAICAGAWDRVDALVSPEAAAAEDVASLRLALHWAAMNGAPARVILQLVDSYPEGLNKVDIDGATALMIACDCGHVDAATALLRCDPPADTELADSRGWTAMMRAARTGSSAIVDAIVESWRSTHSAEELAALVSFTSHDGRSAADWAEVYHQHDLAARLRTLAPSLSSPHSRANMTAGLVHSNNPGPADGALGLIVGADGSTLPRLTESIPPASRRAPGAAAGRGLAEGFAEVIVRAVQAKSGESGLEPVAEWLGQLLGHISAAQNTDSAEQQINSVESGVLAKKLGERFDALEERVESLQMEGAVQSARLDETTTCLKEVWQSAATELRDDICSTRRWAERTLLEQEARTAKVEDRALRLHQALDRAGIKVELSKEEAAQLAAEQAAAATAIQLRYRRFVAQRTATEQRHAAGAIQRAWRERKTEALSKVAGEMPGWSVTDVSCWLREVVGLGQYCETFEVERVNGAVLMLLGKLELMELGVASALHSARILAAVGQLNQQLRMDISGEVEVLGLAESPPPVGVVVEGSAREEHAPKSVTDADEALAATFIQANFRGTKLRRQLAAEEDEEDGEYFGEAEQERTALVTEAEALLRAKGERQQAAVETSRKKRSYAEVDAMAKKIVAGAASAAFAQQAQGESLKDKQAAAARIQSMQRGKQTRRELQEQTRAATRIAAVHRGQQERRNVRALRRAAPQPEPEPEPEHQELEDDDSEQA